MTDVTNKPAQANAEANKTDSTATADKTVLSREERKAARDDAFKKEQENNPNKAPKDLFSKNPTVTEAKEDPVALTVFKQQIDAYVAASGKGKGVGKDVEQATMGLQLAIRNLLKMSGKTLSEAFVYLYNAGRGDTTAFKVPFPMRFAHNIKGENDRLIYANFMNLMCRYMKLKNPATIHDVVDVSLALEPIKNVEQQSNVAKLFAK